MAANNSFSITGTSNRDGAKDDYIVRVPESVKKDRELREFGVVVYPPPSLQNHENPSVAEDELAVPCRICVLSDEENRKAQEESYAGKTAIEIDQSLRDALGMKYEYKKDKPLVKLFPLELTWRQWIREKISYRLGRRYLFLRVLRAFSLDIEKNLSRIPTIVFPSIGCENGDFIKCQSPVKEGDRYILKEISISAYEATDEMINGRNCVEKKLNEEDFRYASSKKILDLTIDIYPIFLDLHDRDFLEVLQLNPIRVRRDLVKAFIKEIREFVIVSVLSSIAVLEFVSQLKPLDEFEPYHWIIAVSVIMVASFAFIAIRIWSKIK